MFYLNDSLFNDLFDNNFKMFEGSMLKADLEEVDGAYHLSVDIPGVDKKNVSLQYNDGYLTVTVDSTKNKDTKDSKKESKYLSKERCEITGSRSFLIEGVDEANIKAKFENGVLEVVLPKLKVVEPQKKLIEIE